MIGELISAASLSEGERDSRAPPLVLTKDIHGSTCLACTDFHVSLHLRHQEEWAELMVDGQGRSAPLACRALHQQEVLTCSLLAKCQRSQPPTVFLQGTLKGTNRRGETEQIFADSQTSKSLGSPRQQSIGETKIKTQKIADILRKPQEPKENRLSWHPSPWICLGASTSLSSPCHLHRSCHFCHGKCITVLATHHQGRD